MEPQYEGYKTYITSATPPSTFIYFKWMNKHNSLRLLSRTQRLVYTVILSNYFTNSNKQYQNRSHVTTWFFLHFHVY